MAELPKLQDGWIYVDRANTKGIFAGSRKKDGKVTGEFSVAGPIWVPVPVTRKAQTEAFGSYDRKYDTPDGKQTVKGPEAGAAEKYFQGWEILRQLGCDMAEEGVEITAELLQSKVADIEPLSGKKGGFRTVKAEETKLDDLVAKGDAEALKAYLKAQGLKLS